MDDSGWWYWRLEVRDEPVMDDGPISHRVRDYWPATIAAFDDLILEITGQQILVASSLNSLD